MAALMEDAAGELRSLIAKATAEDLSDGGRYFAETYEDLTCCRHEEIGEYQHAADGELIEWLWNRRNEIAGLYAAHSEPRPVAPSQVEPWHKGAPVVPSTEVLLSAATHSPAPTEAGKPCDFWLGDCRRCGKRADRDNQLEPCRRPNGPFAPSTQGGAEG